MSAATPFPIHKYGGRPHQPTPVYERVRLGTDAENYDGAVVEHVRDGKALTPKGAALLAEFARRAS